MLRAAVAIVVAVALLATHWRAYVMGGAEVRSAWNAEKLDTARQTLKLIDVRDRTTQDLQTAATKQRSDKNAQITRLDAYLADALKRLSNRADRPIDADLPTDTAAGANARCTGAELYRADAQFLSREAARAERVVAELGECQAAYSRAREALK